MDLPHNEHTLETLRGRFRSGARLKFVFFWSHQEHEAGLSKACLNQWYASPFVVDGGRFPTAEHFMMYRKAQLFGDEQSAAEILRAPSAGAAKALGRVVRGFDEAVWRQQRSEIALAGNYAKFSQSPPLRDFLLSTKRRR